MAPGPGRPAVLTPTSIRRHSARRARRCPWSPEEPLDLGHHDLREVGRGAFRADRDYARPTPLRGESCARRASLTASIAPRAFQRLRAVFDAGARTALVVHRRSPGRCSRHSPAPLPSLIGRRRTPRKPAGRVAAKFECWRSGRGFHRVLSSGYVLCFWYGYYSTFVYICLWNKSYYFYANFVPHNEHRLKFEWSLRARVWSENDYIFFIILKI
jgi:hypothetical protein